MESDWDVLNIGRRAYLAFWDLPEWFHHGALVFTIVDAGFTDVIPFPICPTGFDCRLQRQKEQRHTSQNHMAYGKATLLWPLKTHCNLLSLGRSWISVPLLSWILVCGAILFRSHGHVCRILYSKRKFQQDLYTHSRMQSLSFRSFLFSFCHSGLGTLWSELDECPFVSIAASVHSFWPHPDLRLHSYSAFP